MKTRCITLIAILCFSLPLITEAEIQNNTAKRDAEKDAKIHNQLEWFAGGCLGGSLPWLLLFVLFSADIDGDGLYLIDELPLVLTYGRASDIGCLSTIGAGMLLPTGYAIFHSPAPRADQFLGKSPDYINTYTTTYNRRAKKQRIVLSATGCAVGTCLGISLLSRFLPPEYYEGDDPD